MADAGGFDFSAMGDPAVPVQPAADEAAPLDFTSTVMPESASAPAEGAPLAGFDFEAPAPAPEPDTAAAPIAGFDFGAPTEAPAPAEAAPAALDVGALDFGTPNGTAPAPSPAEPVISMNSFNPKLAYVAPRSNVLCWHFRARRS
eukprot:COSAG01_NODE_13885_length_1522_cov_1.594519_1_plen_145_part_00